MSSYYDKNDPHTIASEKKLRRKMDMHIMPILLFAELFGRYEQSVVTNAKLGGLLEDLNMSEFQYRWCLSAYYVAFFVVNIPINILFRRGRPSIFLTILIFTWGTLVLCMTATTNFAGLLVCRIILGASEAVYDPIQMYYISLWYTRHELARRSGFTAIVSALGGATIGLIAFGISQIPTNTLNTWQWLFIIFGAPSILLAIATLFFLPDKPETAKFFTEEERKLELDRLKADQGAAEDSTWSWIQVKSVLTDWKTYAYGIISGLSTIPGAGVRLALPSIIDGLGTWAEDISQALTTPPNIVACFFIFLTAYYSDRLFQRAYFLIAANVVAIIGFLMIMFIPEQHVGVRYFTVCILIAATRVDGPIRLAWYTSNHYGLTRRAVASGIIFCIDAIGSAVGGQIYFDPPLYWKGHAIGLATVALQSIAILTLRFTLKRINSNRAKMTPEEKERQIEKYGGHELVGDRHPDFRYGL
ncbi:major facilitator superfamily domain-containing protein [Zychaea mexicana]|uniref:major facilitator superfamily domain-containing protein n=1 Tax=Zychaea mexicana TaxID=64656 RepID=UPI0022FE63D7|nr:major facilitator superfamily domain-containing protein [Zychaea mexicana]KAI9490312.1 major facilitator superfamily domain-containing protein [Zychaea mexicana]